MIYQNVLIAGNKTLAQLPALPLIKGTESSQYRITYLICQKKKKKEKRHR